MQPLNIDSICETNEVSKFVTFNDFKDSQFSNIEIILSTLLVLKFETSNDINDLQFLNILFIKVTLEVSKFKSKYAKFSQLLNISLICPPMLVLKWDKFREVKDIQL